MNEGQYRTTGWVIFVCLLAVAFYMCITRTFLMAFFLNLSVSMTGNELVQISWLLTFAVFGLPGYMIKNYYEQKAWQAHVEAMPKADPRDSAKRSKYVEAPANMPAAKPIDLSSLPQAQEEFILTCGTCGHLFSAKRGQTNLTCPSCGEPVEVK